MAGRPGEGQDAVNGGVATLRLDVGGVEFRVSVFSCDCKGRKEKGIRRGVTWRPRGAGSGPQEGCTRSRP